MIQPELVLRFCSRHHATSCTLFCFALPVNADDCSLLWPDEDKELRFDASDKEEALPPPKEISNVYLIFYLLFVCQDVLVEWMIE